MYTGRHCPTMAFVNLVSAAVSRWIAPLSLISTSKFLLVSFNTSDVNSVHLLVIISCCSPCSHTISLINRSATCCASRSREPGIQFLLFLRGSMTTSMVSSESEFGRFVMQSILIYFYDQAVTSSDFSNVYGACQTPFVRWHESEFWTIYLICSIFLCH